MTKLVYSTNEAAHGKNSVRLIDIAARATAAARELAALGNTPSERRIIAAVTEQAMRRVFAEVRS